MKITEEMIEAFGDEWKKALEFEEVLGNDRWFIPAGYKRKRSLEAVLPLIEAALREEIAAEIEAAREARKGENDYPYGRGWLMAMRNAARITRKDAS